MIYQLLALSLCLQYASACIPVRPGEDMPCPQVPEAQTIDPMYLNKGLTPMHAGGSMIYGCMGDDVLLELDNGMFTPLLAGATIECKPKSGLFTFDGTAVGSKTYVCGEKIVPCPDLPKATDLGTGRTVVEGPTMMPNAAGDQVYMCTPPGRLYSQEGNDPGKSSKLPVAAFVVCRKQSGILSLNNNGENEIDLDTFSFACGTTPCETCDQSKLLDPTAACATQDDLICTAKPTTTEDANGCPVVSCGADMTYQLLTDSTYQLVPDPTMITCDAGDWKVGGTAITSMGFVCGFEAKCDVICNGLIGNAYTGMDVTVPDLTMAPVLSKPLCTYSCGADAVMFVNDVMHTTAVCNMMTGKVTADNANGVELTPGNQFSCEKCNCDTNMLTDGLSLCDFGRTCVKPTPGANTCMVPCPGGSTARYLDMNGVPQSTTLTTIQCLLPLGMDWVAEGSSEVTCQYPEDQGLETMQPAKGPNYMCDPISTPTTICGTRMCKPDNIRYIITSSDEYTVTCSEGLLISDDQPDGAMVRCTSSGMLFGSSGEVNCVIDDTVVATCKASTTVAFTHECKLNVCRLQCAVPNQMFDTDLGPFQYLKCEGGEILTMDGNFVDPATLMCM